MGAVAWGAAEVWAVVVFDVDDLLGLLALTEFPPSFGTTGAPVASTPGGTVQSVRLRGAQAGEPTMEPVKTRLTQFLSENA